MTLKPCFWWYSYTLMKNESRSSMWLHLDLPVSGTVWIITSCGGKTLL